MKPSRRLLLFSLTWLLVAISAYFFPALETIWLPFGIALIIAACLDLLVSKKPPLLSIERRIQHNLPVNCWHTVKLVIHNRSPFKQTLQLYDLHPNHCISEDLPASFTLQSKHFVEVHYRIKAEQRGDAHFSGVQIYCNSRLALWKNKFTYENQETIKVYPNFAEVAKYTLLALDNQLSQLGIRQKQRRGQGLDFHQLREYRDGDSMRQIDWKATSRYRRLISREYREERDQQIVFLIDCGRRMRAKDQDIIHFDQALNAMLLLSYVALHQGDMVSLMAFGGQRRYFTSRKGVQQINAILNYTYDLDTTLEASDYTAAARELINIQRKRSLIVLLTNARDEDQDNLITAVQLLRSRHLVLLANLREQALDNVIEERVESFDQAILYAAANDYIHSRKQIHAKLGQSGAITLDVTAQELPVSIVNRYFEIKQSNIL